jgi:hypothetical protein
VIGEKATVMKKAAISEKTIVGEKATVKIVESTVEESATSSKAWPLKLVESATLKTHTTAMKTPTAKTLATCAYRHERE